MVTVSDIITSNLDKVGDFAALLVCSFKCVFFV